LRAVVFEAYESIKQGLAHGLAHQRELNGVIQSQWGEWGSYLFRYNLAGGSFMWRAIDALKQKTCTGQVFGGENVALMARFTQTV